MSASRTSSDAVIVATNTDSLRRFTANVDD
jgi:hypothetical protein